MNEDKRTIALRREQAAGHQVRVADGARPVLLQGLPADHPFRTVLRDRARGALVASG
jgi:hypothetical protein